MAGIAKLSVIVGAQTAPLQADLARADGIIRGFAGRMGLALGGIMGGFTAGAAFSWGVKLAAQAQTAQIAFEVLLGSASKAEAMLGQLRALAASTPLEFTGLQENARALLGFGLSAEQVLPALRAMGNITGGNAEKMSRLTLAYAQSAAAGRLMGQDLLQMINAGFNPLQEISKNTGLSMVELKKQMEDGAISFDMVRQAFESATGEGGRFNGMLDRMATTLEGRWGKLKDSAGLFAAQIATALMPALEKFLAIGEKLLDWMRQMDANTIQNIAKIGLWVGAIIAAVTIIPRMVAAISAIVTALRAMATAQAIQQAMSGPKGWAMLAASLVIAGGAAVAVAEIFRGTNEKMTASSDKAKKAAAGIDAIGKSAAKTAGEVKKAGDAIEVSPLFKMAADVTEQNLTPFETFAKKMQDLNLLISQGFITWDTYGRAVAKARAELNDATKAKEEFNKPARVNIGAVTRNSSAGFQAIESGRNTTRDLKDANAPIVDELKTANQLLEDLAASIGVDSAPFIVQEVSF